MAARVTATAVKVVWVHIQGEPRTFPAMPFDDGLVHRFTLWMLENDVLSYYTARSGGGAWIGAFYPADAKRVLEWLAQEGVERVSAHPDAPGMEG